MTRSPASENSTNHRSKLVRGKTRKFQNVILEFAESVNIYIVFTFHQVLKVILRLIKRYGRLYATMPFYTRSLSICGFWYLQVVLDQYLLDINRTDYVYEYVCVYVCICCICVYITLQLYVLQLKKCFLQIISAFF